MGYSLYPDQKHDVQALRGLLKSNRKVVYQLSTGGGKTVVAGYIAQQARRKGSKILVLVHRRELVGQFVNTLHEAGLDQDVGVVCPGWTPTPWAPIQIAMVFSWHRRDISFEPDLIIVDEAHHARAKTWEDVLARYEDPYVLGLTATPIRLDGKGLCPPFHAIHCGLSTPELIDKQRLCPIRVMRVDAGFRERGMKMTGGDFNRKSLEKRMGPIVVGKTVEAYLKHMHGRKTIMFGVSKRHAAETAARLCTAGIRAVAVGDHTPDEVREETFKNFGEGRIDVVCNVSLIDEGFDVPTCDAVMDAAPTASLTRFLQRAGRMMRFTNPDKVGLLVDTVGNTWRHGLPDISREWPLTVENPKEDKAENRKKAEQLRCCKQCLSLFNSSYDACPFCGAEHDGRPVVEVDVELVEAKEASGAGKARPKPRKSRKNISSVMSEVRFLARQEKFEDAWKKLVDMADEVGYERGWCHVTAGICGIPRSERKEEED